MQAMANLNFQEYRCNSRRNTVQKVTAVRIKFTGILTDRDQTYVGSRKCRTSDVCEISGESYQ